MALLNSWTIGAFQFLCDNEERALLVFMTLLQLGSADWLQSACVLHRRETPLLRIEKVKGCMFVNQYLVVKYVGRGACGKVFLCLNVQDSRLYAMKVCFL